MRALCSEPGTFALYGVLWYQRCRRHHARERRPGQGRHGARRWRTDRASRRIGLHHRQGRSGMAVGRRLVPPHRFRRTGACGDSGIPVLGDLRVARLRLASVTLGTAYLSWKSVMAPARALHSHSPRRRLSRVVSASNDWTACSKDCDLPRGAKYTPRCRRGTFGPNRLMRGA